MFRLPNTPVSTSALPDIPNNLVLGKRAELFFKTAIEAHANYRVLAHNLQIIHEKQTLGEFDFFVEDLHQQQQLHIELVYKFYVYDPSFEEEKNRWIGPNRRDSLQRKLSHLQQHQLPLLYRNESQSVLKNAGIKPENCEQRLCFKAHLFVPKHRYGQSDFPIVNHACIIGYWLHRDEFTASVYADFLFFSPKKPDWPMHPQHQQHWKHFSEIEQEIDFLLQHQKSAFIWMKKSAQVYERFFVVWW